MTTSMTSQQQLHGDLHNNNNNKNNVIITNIAELKLLSAELSRALGDGGSEEEDIIFCDVVFIVGDEKKRIPAHRIILASRCLYFRNMFASGFRETSEKEIPLPDVNPEVFTTLLHYIYTGELRLNPNIVMDLLSLSNQYGLARVKNMCAEYVRESIDVDNVCDLYSAARMHQASELLRACMEMIELRAMEVFETPGFYHWDRDVLCEVLTSDSLCLDELTIFERILAWGKYHLLFLLDESDEIQISTSLQNQQQPAVQQQQQQKQQNNNNNNNDAEDYDTQTADSSSNNDETECDSSMMVLAPTIAPHQESSADNVVPVPVPVPVATATTHQRQLLMVNINICHAVARMSDEHKRALKRMLKPIFKYVRWPMMQPEDLMELVEPLGVVPRSLLYEAFRFHSNPHKAMATLTTTTTTNRCSRTNNNDRSSMMMMLMQKEKQHAEAAAMAMVAVDMLRFRPRSNLLQFKWDDTHNKNEDISISENGLTVIKKGSDHWSTVRGTVPFIRGRHYWEIHIDRLPNRGGCYCLNIGIMNEEASLASHVGVDQNSWSYVDYKGTVWHSRSRKYGEPFGQGDVIGVLLDFTNSSNDASSVISSSSSSSSSSDQGTQLLLMRNNSQQSRRGSSGGSPASSSDDTSTLTATTTTTTTTVATTATSSGHGGGTLTFFKNGKSFGVAFTGIKGPVYAACSLYFKDDQITLRPRAHIPSSSSSIG